MRKLVDKVVEDLKCPMYGVAASCGGMVYKLYKLVSKYETFAMYISNSLDQIISWVL